MKKNRSERSKTEGEKERKQRRKEGQCKKTQKRMLRKLF